MVRCFKIIPFCVAKQDFSILQSLSIIQNVSAKESLSQRILYILKVNFTGRSAVTFIRSLINIVKMLS